MVEKAKQKKQATISSFFTTSSSPLRATPSTEIHARASVNGNGNGTGAIKESGARNTGQTQSSGNNQIVSPKSDQVYHVTNRKRVGSGNDDEDEKENESIYENGEDGRASKRLRRSRSSSRHDVQSTSPAKLDTVEHSPPRFDDMKNQPTMLDRKGSSQRKDRLHKYGFQADPAHGIPADTPSLDETEDEKQARSRKLMLHKQFLQKLGSPDSFANLRRRNHILTAEEEEEEAVSDAEEAEEKTYVNGRDVRALASEKIKTNAVGKSVASFHRPTAKKKEHKLTPMEKQVIEIKRKHIDTLLVVEVGYKYRFFGEDARIAAKELSIVCIPGKYRFDEHPSEAHLDRFASASIPVHRLHVHVKRLVAAGHKVGVVRQLETAALKAAGDNRNAPFVRKLTNLYTKGTYVDDVEGLDDSPTTGGAPATGHLLCLTETNAKGWGTDEKVHVGIVAVQPATGDIIYDDFEDGFMRSEIETRLLHIAPCEFVVVGDLSRATEKLVQHLSGSKTNVFGDKARVERVVRPKNMAAQAYSHIQNFYTPDKVRGGIASEHVLDKVHKLSEHVTICLSAMITHLAEYGLEHVFDLTKNFQAFSARSHMLLNGNTLASLEIYQNQTDYSERGSLFWVMDQTQTRFGQRMLRKWVGRPLLDREKLQERIDAVEELRSGESTGVVDKLRQLLTKIRSDLEKSLLRIYYKKCSRPELLNVLQTLQRIATEYAHVRSNSDTGFTSSLLSSLIVALPTILDDVVTTLDSVNTASAQQDDKYTFLREEHETSAIQEHKAALVAIEEDFNSHLIEAARKLRVSGVKYSTVAGIDYLIEVDNALIKNVPASWAKISGTKKVSRFHTPEVVRLIRERDQHKETLAAACDLAFTTLLEGLGTHYQSFRDCVQALATLDCLLSLATVASRPGYCKPTFSKGTQVQIQDGRHPMIEQLLLDSYVPNSLHLSGNSCNDDDSEDSVSSSQITRAILITGPNMGGKSSLVRQIALISIMGQIGSYVPATSATLGLLDAVFTRMGAMDNMAAGESTFMVELSETADILKQATSRSLIILDELGRGTSTHDGVSIAGAVLDWFLRQTRALVLFVTHYQSLANMADSFEPGVLKNVHMAFRTSAAASYSTANGPFKVSDDAKSLGRESDTEVMLSIDREEEEEITFLYELAEGIAHRSYGLNVAKLAHIPRTVIDTARDKSRELEMDVKQRRLCFLAHSLRSLLLEDHSIADVHGHAGEEIEEKDGEEGQEGPSVQAEIQNLVYGIDSL